MKSDNYLTKLGLTAWNDMQTAAMQALQKQGNYVLLSPTGSGKTLAYLIPLLPYLEHSTLGTKALIIVPTRELALQIKSVYQQLGQKATVACCYGGHSLAAETRQLVHQPALIVGTPGRLVDHVRNHRLNLEDVRFLVIDEYDQCLNIGFDEEMSYLMRLIPRADIRLLTSATPITETPADGFTSDCMLLDFTSQQPDNRWNIYVLNQQKNNRIDQLYDLLCQLAPKPVIVFCRERAEVEETGRQLWDRDIPVSIYHGGLDQQDREQELLLFRQKAQSVLLCTDLGSRGLDISGVEYVVHFHLPEQESAYIHRNGRSGRWANHGSVILMTSADEVLPDFIPTDIPSYPLRKKNTGFVHTEWQTCCFTRGRKDKVNRSDWVGYLIKVGQLTMQDIGDIHVESYQTFIAIRRNRLQKLKTTLQGHLVKKLTVRMWEVFPWVRRNKGRRWEKERY